MEVISSLKTSLRLAKDREQTLEDELLMSRVVQRGARRSTSHSIPDCRQRQHVGINTARFSCLGGGAIGPTTVLGAPLKVIVSFWPWTYPTVLLRASENNAQTYLLNDMALHR